MKILRLRSHFGTKAILNMSRKLAVDVWKFTTALRLYSLCSNKVVREVLIVGLHDFSGGLLLTPRALHRILETFYLVQYLNL